MAKARQQYFADEVTLQKENRDFAIQPELVEKLEGIEAGAQVNVIETVKVNGEALIPDENKAVDVSVPLVEDTLYSTDTDKALSANQGKVLYEYIQNLASRGRYLSNWNTVTGLPSTSPVDNPYQYRAGDYYVVSNVATEGGTNYRPDGSSYSWGVASTTVETETVRVGDYYTYDGQHWLLLVNTSREIAVDSSLSTSSTNPVENRVITNALNTKQNNITDLETIRSGAALGATALQPGAGLSELTGTSDDITQGTTNLFMTTAERSKLSNQSGVNTGDETQTTIKNKLGQASASTDGYLTSTDWNAFNNKQGTISDLETIRSNASAGKNASDTIATYGDVVTHDANEFATASQGAKADTALQSGDNVSELVNDAGYITDAYHDSTKQDKLIAGANIQIAADGKTISATDTTYVAGDFDIKDLADTTGLRTEWSGKQDELIAGNNIQIAADGKTISATDTIYTAGVNVSISNNNVISATDSKAEWGNISGTLSDQIDLQSALDAKQGTLTAGANIQIAQDGTISATDTTYTAGTGIDITNGVISNTQTSAEWGNITGTLSNQTDLQTALDAKQDDMVILSYGNSTWNDFITAYQKNGVVYCRASSNSNPATGSQGRLAFMAYVNNADNPTEVEFQYYRSRSDHNSAANQLDEVYVYKLVPASGGTWTVTQRNTAAKAAAGTGINLTYGSGNMTIANTGVTSINSQTGDVTLTIPTVPTNVSDFVNDAGYITANDLPTVDTSMSDSSTNAVQNNVIKNYVDTQVQEATSGAVSDTAYGSSWDGITGIAPSKNAVYDKISAMDTTIAGKQDTISDLSTIRTGAGKGATAVQPGDNVSTLTNDAGFITKAVSDLTNYYTKSETYTKAEVADYVANFAGFKVVTTLPTTDIKTTIIYLLGPVGTGADKYEEYIYSNNTWVKIGETSVDLTNYFNTSTDNSDSITEGSTNLFLTSAERTKLSNTSGTNTGDETKATIQSKLGAATSSNDGYLTSADWSTFNSKQNTLTAGENIDITNNVISATGLQNKLTAGDNITITENCESDMQGPCDSGFHIPLKSEWEGLKTIMTSLSLTTGAQYKTNLHMPFVGYRAYSDGSVRNQTYAGDYWASNIEAAGRENAYYINLSSSDRNIRFNYFGFAYSIRAFKNEYVAPTSSWTVIAGTLGNAGIFWNSTDGLITVTDGTTGYTIQDKNVGATTVYNDGDTLSEANMGNLFQRGNNYGFSSSTSVTPTTSTTQVDTSSYGPENPYSSSTYIIDNANWQSTTNGDLWGGESLGTHCQSTISSNTNTNTFLLPSQGDDISDIITLLNNGGGVVFYKTYSELATVVGTRYYVVTDYNKQQGIIKAEGDIANATITLTSGTTTVASVTTGGENVKKFSLSSTSDTTTAEKVVDWYNGGNIPVIVYDSVLYVFHSYQYNSHNGKSYYTFLANTVSTNNTSTSSLTNRGLVISYNPNAAFPFSINISDQNLGEYLRTGVDYATPYTPEYDGSPATKKYVDDNIPAYIAGNNVTIEEVCESDMRGPAPSGFHVPSTDEWQGLKTIMDGLSLTTGDNWRINLHMPFAGYRSYSYASLRNQEFYGLYWSSSYGSDSDIARCLYLDSSDVNANDLNVRANGYSVRCFKDSYVEPTSSRTVVQGTLGSAGIFWSQSEGLISITDGSTGYTIMDKNIGATSVYNDGDTLSQANMGNMYQWGNNYGFPSTGSLTTSGTKVDASNYGPGNYYNSSTFITGSNDRSSIHNDNLWGGVTQLTQCSNVISATDTTYESKTAASGGTDVSLVTTGEKYTWNNKANTSDITVKAYYTTGTMDLQTFMNILNGLAASNIAPIIVYASNTTDIYYYDTGDVAGTSVSLYFYAPSNGVSNGMLYNKKLTVTYNMTAGTVTLTKSNESLAVGGGDMSYSDFSWQSKSGATVTLDLASTITPSANFTVNAPSTIKDGQTYILRVNNGATAYTMTLGTNVTNPFDTDITLTANGVDQFVFLAIGGALELQPEGGGGGIAPAANSPINVKYIWAGTQAQYEALSSYDDNTVYLTV